jgi:AbrB family looped-hinge helix DNA binding protein
MITTITTKGQVTVPAEIRKMLNIAVGDKVYFTDVEKEKKKIVLKVIPQGIVEELAGSLSSKIKNKKFKEVRKKAGQLLIKKYQVR